MSIKCSNTDLEERSKFLHTFKIQFEEDLQAYVDVAKGPWNTQAIDTWALGIIPTPLHTHSYTMSLYGLQSYLYEVESYFLGCEEITKTGNKEATWTEIWGFSSLLLQYFKLDLL